MKTRDDDALSRGEVETLCILDAVGEGCPAAGLARRLGLSDTLAGAIAEATEPLVVLGLLDRDDDRLTVTDAGRARLAARLAALGVG